MTYWFVLINSYDIIHKNASPTNMFIATKIYNAASNKSSNCIKLLFPILPPFSVQLCCAVASANKCLLCKQNIFFFFLLRKKSSFFIYSLCATIKFPLHWLLFKPFFIFFLLSFVLNRWWLFPSSSLSLDIYKLYVYICTIISPSFNFFQLWLILVPNAHSQAEVGKMHIDDFQFMQNTL